MNDMQLRIQQLEAALNEIWLHSTDQVHKQFAFSLAHGITCQCGKSTLATHTQAGGDGWDRWGKAWKCSDCSTKAKEEHWRGKAKFDPKAMTPKPAERGPDTD